MPPRHQAVLSIDTVVPMVFHPTLPDITFHVPQNTFKEGGCQRRGRASRKADKQIKLYNHLSSRDDATKANPETPKTF
jgi:hypothetical protein